MLTAPQARMLRILADVQPDDRPMAPREVAHKMWPDSPAWEKRTRRYGANRNGALGGTMPMKAATMLWRLKERGLVWDIGTHHGTAHWAINEAGKIALNDHEKKNLEASNAGV